MLLAERRRGVKLPRPEIYPAAERRFRLVSRHGLGDFGLGSPFLDSFDKELGLELTPDEWDFCARRGIKIGRHLIRVVATAQRECHQCGCLRTHYLVRWRISTGRLWNLMVCYGEPRWTATRPHKVGNAYGGQAIADQTLRDKGIDPETLTVAGDDTGKSEPCAVKGCKNKGSERNHWAPQSIFKDEADDWPTAPLCLEHHEYWHLKMGVADRFYRRKDAA